MTLIPVSNISSPVDWSTKAGRGAVDGVALVRLHRAELVDRLADDVQDAAEGRRAHRHRDRAAGVDRLHAPHHAVGGLHAHAAHPVLPEVLLHLGDHVDRDLAVAASAVMWRAL